MLWNIFWIVVKISICSRKKKYNTVDIKCIAFVPVVGPIPEMLLLSARLEAASKVYVPPMVDRVRVICIQVI